MLSQAYLYRMFKASQKEILSTVPAIEYLKAQALNGSRMALQDLNDVDYKQAQHIRELLKYGYAGTGANWFREDLWFYRLTQSKLMSKDFTLDTLGFREELPHVVINSRGDRVIHAASGVGAYRVVEQLLQDVHIDVN